jgi:hypothetical protein
MTTDELLERVDAVKAVPGGFMARCPAHEDRHASLSIKDAGDDLVIKCHAGCTFDAILAAVPPVDRKPTERRIDATYTYRAADGTPVYDVVRYFPKDFRQRRADGTWSMQGVERVPYRLPELLAAKGIVVVEGEKDADRLAAIGIPATCNAGGAGKWRADFAEYFADKQVWLIPDNDDAGRAHMADVARSLQGVAREVRLVTLSVPPKGDVSDWLDAAHEPTTLRAMLRTAPAYPVDADPPAPAPLGIGSRTAASLRYGPPPDQLADPFLTPEGPTILYAKGGTGKGITACWLIHRLVTAGHVVMVLDYEGHEREWGSRLRGLGLTDDELARVHYRAPYGDDWTAGTGPLAVVAEAVRDDCDRLAVTFLVVDSYTMATTNGDTMGGEQAAREYFSGLARIGRPSLTIAHVKGDSERFPARPFGSVFVHNLARETWAAEAVGDRSAPDHDPDVIRFGPSIVELELRNMKANGRGKSPPRFLAFSFHQDGSITVDTEKRGARLADLAEAVMDRPMSARDVVAAVAEDFGESVTEAVMRETLRRHPRRFQSSAERPRKWSRAA